MRANKPLMVLMAATMLAGFLPGCTTATPAVTESLDVVNSARNKPAIRGGVVYKTYCTLCHGERADGEARGAKLYGEANLTLMPGSSEYTEKIIRYGGEAVGKAKFMPAWQEELSEEQINDVIAYLFIVQDPVGRGGVVFKTNCILCHGTKGDGKGRMSAFLDPPPANLTKSDKNDEYKKMIITLGGTAMGRSDRMPVWGEQISEQQIDDVVAYLRTILVRQVE